MKRVTVDGNTACAHIAYLMNDQAVIYPITPSSTMSELCDQMSSYGDKNMFGRTMKITQMQSEAGVAGALHGALSVGSLTTTFTSSQGLLLMIPNMYKIAGELLPTVFYVASRSLATHALNIFCDHSDIYACMKTGFNIIACSSVQEVNDMAIACQLSALKSETPFICFFDGFRTSHELNTIEQSTLEEIKSIVDFDDIKKFKNRAMSNTNPYAKGTNQNPDVFFQNRIASNKFYKNVCDVVKNSFEKVATITNRHYDTIEYTGDQHARDVVVAMGSACDTLNLVSSDLKKTGVIKIRMLKPFDSKTFLEKLPKTVKNITVLERNFDANGVDVLKSIITDALYTSGRHIKLFAGVYGLGGKEFTPDMAYACFDNMKNRQKEYFTIGIYDNVTNSSLEIKPIYHQTEEFACRIYGFGSDGSVSSAKNIIKILGEKSFAQGYFDYDSKKSGSLTMSHIRTSKSPINKPFNSTSCDIVLCNNPSFLTKYEMTDCLKGGGKFVVNCSYDESELDEILPNHIKADIQNKHLEVYTIDAGRIAKENGLGGKINTIMQTCLFKVMNNMSFKVAVNKIKNGIVASYSKKGDEIVASNLKAVDSAINQLKKIKTDNFTIKAVAPRIADDDYYEDIIRPIERQEGDYIAVSKFAPDGKMPIGTAKLEKRGIASQIPEWIPENCIQCGRCSAVCPHACLSAIEFEKNENCDLKTRKSFLTQKDYRIQCSPLDCTGCGVCSEVCPVKKKALIMNDSLEYRNQEKKNYEKFLKLKATNPAKVNNIKSLQYYPSYFEFSGACAGCGETPYLKLVSKMFGDRMIIANATGCSSIYGGTYPTCPYTMDKEGFGPSWANSLFEDNAEFGYGMAYALKNERQNFIDLLTKHKNKYSKVIKEMVENFLQDSSNHKQNREIVNRLNFYKCTHIVDDCDKEIFDNIRLFVEPSTWIIGGDGWAYDIGFGGLDHVVASGENVNILILDTEVYSNTGGQTSKSTPRGASAKFNVAGKTTMKKDILAMLASYKDVYLAQVSLGGNPDQCIKAFEEAEKYDGPSVILAYAPCINHGYDMTNSQNHCANAVKSGYTTLFRYNPNAEEKWSIDSTTGDLPYEEYALSENRFRIVKKTNPENQAELLQQSKLDAKSRQKNLKDQENNN